MLLQYLLTQEQVTLLLHLFQVHRSHHLLFHRSHHSQCLPSRRSQYLHSHRSQFRRSHHSHRSQFRRSHRLQYRHSHRLQYRHLVVATVQLRDVLRLAVLLAEELGLDLLVCLANSF